MILTENLRKQAVILALMLGAVASAAAAKLRCPAVKCAPGLMCVENGPKRCVPRDNVEGDGISEPKENLKVRDLELYGCINNEERAVPMPKAVDAPVQENRSKPDAVGSAKAELKALDCLKKLGYLMGGAMPKLGCSPVRWDQKTCRWVCGKSGRISL